MLEIFDDSLIVLSDLTVLSQSHLNIKVTLKWGEYKLFSSLLIVTFGLVIFEINASERFMFAKLTIIRIRNYLHTLI